MTFNDYINEGFQFNIKNTTSASWFCDIKRIKLVNHTFKWSAIYVRETECRFHDSMDAALSQAVEDLNNYGFVEIDD